MFLSSDHAYQISPFGATDTFGKLWSRPLLVPVAVTLHGIGWSVPPGQVDDAGRDVVMTLAFRSPVVQVSLPAHYRPNGPSEVMAL